MYECADDILVKIKSAMTTQNGIFYRPPRLLVSGTEFNRRTSLIVKGAESARTVTFSSTVREAQDRAFAGYSRLRSVVLREGLETFGGTRRSRDSVFRGSGLAGVRLPSTLKTLGDHAFAGCARLKNVLFPAGLERIGIGCFSETGLERFRAPPGLKVIDGSAFSKCQNLRRVTLNEGFLTLGSNHAYDEGVFKECGIEGITLPKTLELVGSLTFSDCDNLRVIHVEDNCNVGLTEVEIPASARVGPPPETMVGHVHVWNLRCVRHVMIPEGAARIGSCWFWDCAIESFEVPANTVEIGTYAFYNCKKLRKVVFEKARTTSAGTGDRISFGESMLKMICRGAFYGCSGLGTIRFPDGLEEIGPCAFQSSGLENVRTPQSVRVIHQGAFYECKALKTVVLNEGLEVLGTDERTSEGKSLPGVFQESALGSVVLPSTLKRIASAAF